MGMKARDFFETEEEFSKLLDEAEENAVSDWEMRFVDDISLRVGEHGFDTYISERQVEQLKKIAKGEE